MSIFDQLGFTTIDISPDNEIMSVKEGMTLVPLKIDKNKQDDRSALTRDIAMPEEVRFRGVDRGYGNMAFRNSNSRSSGIVPSNTMVLSRQSAQDHAMSGPGIILKSTSKTYSNCCCVQQSQGGYLSEDHEGHVYNVLPLDLRRELLTKSFRDKNEYGKLWNSISSYISKIPKTKGRGGHLEYFFKPYEKQMEQFSAHFEPVPYQIGAVILFGSEIVGIEIMPTIQHWNYYWKWLIRGCYGSHFLKETLTGKRFGAIEMPQLNGDLDDIKRIMDSYMTLFKEMVNNKLSSLQLKQPEHYKKVGNMSNEIIRISNSNPRIKSGGDIIVQNNRPIYLSMVV